MCQINHKRNEKAENQKNWGKGSRDGLGPPSSGVRRTVRPLLGNFDDENNDWFRKIRDKPNRMCRKASTAPDQAFIVEEALLEDLCAIAGEEAHEGGNIIL